MKAAVCTKYGPPEVLKILEMKEPIPKKDEVLVRIRATTVTTSDCYVRGFNIPWQFWLPMTLVIGFSKPRQAILGMVFSGEVACVGKGVNDFVVGDKVFGFDRFKFGSYAEYKCVSMKGIIAKIPSATSFEEAAAIPYGGLLALFYLKPDTIDKTKKILVCGASGAVGSAAVQIAKFFGANVTGICSTRNLDLVRGLGADSVLDYTKKGYLDGQRNFNLVFDAVPSGAGTGNAFKAECAKLLDHDGKYVSVRKGTPLLNREQLFLLTKMMEDGKIKAVIDRVYRLEEIADAHRYVESWHKKGNVIVRI
jgi:alcohol dehydrogenase